MVDTLGKTLLIVFANAIWAVVPVAAVQLFEEYSVLLIVLLRFLFGGIVVLIIALISLLIYHRTHPELGFKEIYRYLRSQKLDSHHLNQWGYFTIVGFIGITVQIAFFFFSFKILGVVVTVIGFPLALVLIAMFSKETMTFFKGVYLSVLIVAIILIGAGRLATEATNLLDPQGWLSLLLFVVALVVLMNQMVKDPLHPWETQLLIKTHDFYRVVRMLVKLGCIFIIASILLFPLAWLLLLLPSNLIFQQEAVRFFIQLPELGAILMTWQGAFLVLGASVVAYIMLFASEAYWSRSALPFDVWASILSIIEPAGSVLLGVVILKESFPLDYLLLVIFLLCLSILLRYIDENSGKVIAYVALKLVPQCEKKVYEDLFQIRAIQSIFSVVGDYDVVLFIQASNITAFNKIVRKKLMVHPDIEEVKEFLVEEVIK